MAFGGRRVMTSVAMVVAIGAGALGCSSAPASEPERAAPPTAPAETSSTSTSTSTSTTEPARRFEPLLADPDQNIRDQVEAAYLHHWEVLNEAGRTGRTDDLHLVYAGDSLALRVSEIEQLVEEGLRVLGHVEHNYEITVIDPVTAIVMDRYRNYMVRVAADAPDADALGSGRESLFEYQMRKVADRWFVVHVVRYQLSE